MKFTSALTITLLTSMVCSAVDSNPGAVLMPMPPKPEVPDAICTVVAKSVKAVAPTQESKVVENNAMVKAIKDVKKVSLYNYATIWSGRSMVQDDIYVKFIDVAAKVKIESKNKGKAIATYQTMQSTKLYDSKVEKEITKQEEISGDLFIARYASNYKVLKAFNPPGELVSLSMTVDEYLVTDHKVFAPSKKK